MYTRVRGWIGCAVSPGKKIWLIVPLRGRGSSVSWGDEKFALSIDHEIMNSMWVNIVSRLHYQTQRFILNEELLLRSAQHLQQHHLSRTCRYSIGIFLNDEEWVFFYDLHRSFCNSGYFFCARNSKVCCEKETYLSDFRVCKTRKSIIDWNSLPSDLFWI